MRIDRDDKVETSQTTAGIPELPRPLGRICTQPLEVLEDRKGDAGIVHESGVAAPNWLGEDHLAFLLPMIPTFSANE